MRSIGKKLIAAVFALALVVAMPSAAQAQWFVAGSAGVAGLSGDDFDGLGSGFAWSGVLGSRLGSSWSLAGIVGGSSHSFSSDVTTPCVGCGADLDASVSTFTIELQPAIRFGSDDGGASFWVGARGGYASVGADNVDSATGFIFGPAAGVGFPVSDRVTIGAAGNYGWMSLSDDLSGQKWNIGGYILIPFGS